MCTVTFLPDPQGGFILTSNRDEIILREKAEIPVVRKIDNQKIIFPRDPKGGGTWIALSEKGRAVCLLNGAFEPHVSAASYAKSRGLVVLESFRSEKAGDFFNQYSFEGVEPFTLLLTERKELWELRWDGKRKHILQLDSSRPGIWASVTLYPEEIRNKRERWFNSWLTQNDFSVESIRRFHRFGGEGDQRNDVVINRDNRMLTQSITSIVFSQNQNAQVIYEDLLENKTYLTGF